MTPCRISTILGICLLLVLPWRVFAAPSAPRPFPPRYTIIDLGTLGGKTISVSAINKWGEVVGQAQTSRGKSHAFLWSHHRMRDLGTLGGDESGANGINDKGQVVGTADLPTKDKYDHFISRGVVWQYGRTRVLGSFSAEAINNIGTWHMRMNRTLLLKILCIPAVCLLSGVGAFIYRGRHTHAKPLAPHRVVIVVDIGPYPNLDAEEHAALQRLSLELFRHPEASAVRIKAGKSAWRDGVMGYVRVSATGNKGYDRVFWDDDRFSSPVIGWVKGRPQGLGEEVLVSEEPIHVAARKHGSVIDVDRYNLHLRVKLGLEKRI